MLTNRSADPEPNARNPFELTRTFVNAVPYRRNVKPSATSTEASSASVRRMPVVASTHANVAGAHV